MLRDRGRGWGWTLRYDMDSMCTCLGLAQAVDAIGGGMLMFLEDATCSGCHTQWTPRYDMGSTCTCRSGCYGTMGVEGCT